MNDFWKRVKKTDGCWIWTGSVTRGYGRLYFEGRHVYAHRLSWEIANGKIPSQDGYHGTCVCHKCDTPRCVNPAHLFLGSQQDNVNDQVKKERNFFPSGVKNGHAKLTEENVRDIRSRSASSVSSLSREFGVSRKNIRLILSRLTWKHVN